MSIAFSSDVLENVQNLDQEFSMKIQNLHIKKDREVAHMEADDFLCKLLTKLGCKETVKSFKKLKKWY